MEAFIIDHKIVGKCRRISVGVRFDSADLCRTPAKQYRRKLAAILDWLSR